MERRVNADVHARNQDVAVVLGGDPSQPNPEARKLESYPYLDWLRFVLASVVLLSHEAVPLPKPISGSLAVSVFLALSGWLIGGILTDSDRRDLPRFFYNRSTRIWLPYFATVVMLYLCAAVIHGIDGNWFKYLFYDVTFTHYNWTVFPRAHAEMPLGGTGNSLWSLAVEEQFYLTAPLIMLFVPWGKRPLLWGIIAATLVALGSVAAPIAGGVFAAALHRHRPLAVTAAGRWLAAGAAVAILVAMMRWFHEPFVTPFSVCTVLALTAPGSRERVGVFFGGISFPLYLDPWIGQFAINAINKHVIAMPFLVLTAITYLAAVGVSIVAWWLIDRRVMLRRGRWYRPALGRLCGAVAYSLVGIGLAGGYVLRLNNF